MKLMMHKWCWIGLILCASGSVWAAADDDDDKPATETKKSKSSKADSEVSSAKDDTAKDSADKDESGDDEDETVTNPPPKKVAKEKVAAPTRSNTTINIGALLGYGTSAFTRLGFGLRGGATLGQNEGLYLGGIGTLFTGTSVTQNRLTGQAERTRKAIILGAEAGYDYLAADDLLLRPYMTLGIAMVSDHTCATGTCWDDNGAKLTLAPGVQGIYLIGSGIYAGADLRYQIITGASDSSAAAISLTAGVRL
jgi:hypothetical protein